MIARFEKSSIVRQKPSCLPQAIDTVHLSPVLVTGGAKASLGPGEASSDRHSLELVIMEKLLGHQDPAPVGGRQTSASSDGPRNSQVIFSTESTSPGSDCPTFAFFVLH
ncbi:uncharacterized protein LOC144006405 [Festucalex cinctus]